MYSRRQCKYPEMRIKIDNYVIDTASAVPGFLCGGYWSFDTSGKLKCPPKLSIYTNTFLGIFIGHQYYAELL
jgi:hypothetical protein